MGPSSTQDLNRGQRKEGQVERGGRTAEGKKRGRVLKRWNGARQVTHISKLVVPEVGLIALEKLHSQVAIQPVPLLETWSRSEPSPPKGTGQSPAGRG